VAFYLGDQAIWKEWRARHLAQWAARIATPGSKKQHAFIRRIEMRGASGLRGMLEG
jgi:hypothetical protein